MATFTDPIPSEVHVDPDAQATVTDFLDYTEYLPSDITRSLTLIKKLDGSYLSSVDKIHGLLSTYGSLHRSDTNSQAISQELRKEISYYLDHALNARESAYAESSRLYDEVDRHYNRITSVKSKLLALPKPPSRDPSPVPVRQSPQANRIRASRTEEGGTPPPRITLRLDNARSTANASRSQVHSSRPRHRSRRITVPGEVLPPPNPDSPIFTESDWESPSMSPIPMPTSRVGAPARSRSAKLNTIKIPKPSRPLKIKVPKTPRPPRPPRPPGAMGTNVHSAVAGISTSNALSLLTPPPPDAKPGTVHAPWMRLTEWEMARLRKRMKKNAIWTPSETMIRRELSEAGRGPENYRKTRSRAEETGEDFLDCDNIATTAPGKQLVPGEISADSLGYESKLSNKGMKLNEAKKLKKELLAREQAAIAAAEAQQAALKLGEIGTSFKNLFTKPNELPPLSASSSSFILSAPKPPSSKPSKKRKSEAANVPAPAKDPLLLSSPLPLPSPTIPSPTKQPSTKKRKTVHPQPQPPPLPPLTTTTITTTIPLAAPAPSPPKPVSQPAPPPSPSTTRKTPASSSASARSRRPSLTLRGPAPPPEPVSSPPRPTSRHSSRHPSAPPAPAEPARPRGKSATPAPAPISVPTPIPAPAVTTTANRPRRKSATPAPPPIVTTAPTPAPAPSRPRRKSATPAPTPTVATAASRRSKRPAPGPVTDSQDGGAAVSVGKRKNAPRKKGKKEKDEVKKEGKKEEKEKEAEEEVEEDIDPDEPRYCVCGDVSFGIMVLCENPECEKEWFHLECVGLSEPPGRRVKWFCPACLKKEEKKK